MSIVDAAVIDLPTAGFSAVRGVRRLGQAFRVTSGRALSSQLPCGRPARGAGLGDGAGEARGEAKRGGEERDKRRPGIRRGMKRVSESKSESESKSARARGSGREGKEERQGREGGMQVERKLVKKRRSWSSSKNQRNLAGQRAAPAAHCKGGRTASQGASRFRAQTASPYHPRHRCPARPRAPMPHDASRPESQRAARRLQRLHAACVPRQRLMRRPVAVAQEARQLRLEPGSQLAHLGVAPPPQVRPLPARRAPVHDRPVAARLKSSRAAQSACSACARRATPAACVHVCALGLQGRLIGPG
jgi:hypothetical protein